jgi:hypothetical protein
MVISQHSVNSCGFLSLTKISTVTVNDKYVCVCARARACVCLCMCVCVCVCVPTHCSRTLLVQQRGRFLPSVAGSSGRSVLNFVVNFDLGKPFDADIVERERRLAAEKGTGRLALAIQ